MKRYLVFAGSDYCPGGGWEDFKKDYDDLENAKTAAAAWGVGECKWSQVVDTEIQELVHST